MVRRELERTIRGHYLNLRRLLDQPHALLGRLAVESFGLSDLAGPGCERPGEDAASERQRQRARQQRARVLGVLEPRRAPAST